ncbi:MAG: disulfide bond formation protein B [Candidatus Peribacteraceae bacterium]|nr:disulfide bond formation protein B [Candidatus Peribacteraceae bacterium]
MDFVQFTWNIVPFLSVLIVIAHVIVVAVTAVLLYELFTKNTTGFSSWIGTHGLVLMFIVALTATLGSLYFSEISGWTPCKYCWIQRIFMYPQVVILAIALWKRDRSVARYILALCLIGAAYAAYHYYIQMYDIIATPTNPATPCDASGESCVKTPFAHFGYITIPMMALTGFVLNAFGSFFLMRKKGSVR